MFIVSFSFCGLFLHILGKWQSSSQVRLLLIFISVRCLCRETIFQKKHLLFSTIMIKGDCCRGVLSFWRLAMFDDQRLLVLSRKHCSSSDWRVRQCGVGWRKVRLYRDPWGGVVISSTSEGAHTHTQTHTHLIPHHVLHLSISSVELQQTVSDVASFVCACDVRLWAHSCSPQQLGYLCWSGCGVADQRLLWSLCLYFLSVCLHAG